MAYSKHNFSSGDTLYASQLNEMEDQIALNEQTSKSAVKTVNGTAPDSNGNVEVEGGGSSYTYELIESATLQENVAFRRTAEPDGTPYAFKRLLVIMKCTAATGPSGQASRVEYNGQQLATDWISSFTGNDGTKYKWVEFYIDGGYWRADWTDWTNNTRYSNKSPQIFAYSETEYPYITRYTTNGIMVAGTTFEIYGVRA